MRLRGNETVDQDRRAGTVSESKRGSVDGRAAMDWQREHRNETTVERRDAESSEPVVLTDYKLLWASCGVGSPLPSQELDAPIPEDETSWPIFYAPLLEYTATYSLPTRRPFQPSVPAQGLPTTSPTQFPPLPTRSRPSCHFRMIAFHVRFHFAVSGINSSCSHISAEELLSITDSCVNVVKTSTPQQSIGFHVTAHLFPPQILQLLTNTYVSARIPATCQVMVP